MVEMFLDQASSYAGQIDNVVLVVAIITGVWSVLCFGVFFYLLFKFRAKEGVPAQYITGNKPEEKRWVSWPHGLVLVCDVFIIIVAVQAWYHVKQQMPEPDEQVRIVVQQWAWTFDHAGPDGKLDTEDDIRTVDELRVEVDKTYQYFLESRDVMHDFSVPVWRLKQDAIPGRTITGWFKPTQEGAFDIQCAEMCGIGHGIMGAKVFVQGAVAHASWNEQNSGLASLDAE
jgi:cytochrome c oxidase subunit 2